MDDWDLLKDYVQKDSQEAFALLVSRHINLVYSVASRRVGNPESAREIAQAVFVILAQKSKQLGQGTILPAWLYQTTRLTASHWMRSEMRRVHREQEAYMQSLSNPNEPEIWEKLAPLLEDSIAQLGEADRNAIVFRFFQGKSFAEVGAVLGTSEDAAFKRVNRAVEKLRVSFAKRGIALSAGSLAAALSVNAVHAAPVGLASMVAAGATVKGAVLAGPTVTLIKGTLKLMAWTKLKLGLISGTALILAFGAGNLAVTQRPALWPSSASVSRGVTTNSPAAVRVANVASPFVPPFRWQDLESSDYRQYMANLRVAGFPEPVISDIITAAVHKKFALRGREILGRETALSYWQKRFRNQPSADQMDELKRAFKEETSLLESLLGRKISQQAIIDQLCLQVDQNDASMAWLPPEKRDAVRRAFAEAGITDEEALANDHGSDRDARRLGYLKDLLSPAELEEYKLRFSSVASGLRAEAQYANLTPDEFKAVVKVREQFAGKDDLQLQALAGALGGARARDIVNKGNSSYYWMRQAAEQYNLPVASADQAYQLMTDMKSGAAKILTDTSLSNEDQERQFTALQNKTRAAFVGCLGVNGARVAYNAGASYLFFDADSYRKQLQRNP